MNNKVVARFLNGRVLKGMSLDVDPTRPTCHVRSADGKTERVNLKDLKALFFVRSHEGDAAKNDARTTDADDSRLKGSAPITVSFADKESIIGITNRYPPTKPFFFIMPVDPDSNNIRILINKAAVVKMESKAQ
jgi:hypothetical protein